jgi:serine protease Do
MNTFIFTGSQYQEGFIGIGFAIPVDRINEVVNEIRRKGSINREYWIGIYDIRALNPRIVTALKLKIKEGVIITQLDPDGPAFKMGLREYDIVVEVENKAVKTPRDFLTVLNSLDLRVGSTVRMKAVRDEQRLTFDVRLEPLPESMK